MTKAKISEYDAVAANNTDVNGVNIAENCPPSGMNNMGREIMAALKRFQVGSDSDGVTVGGNLVVSGTSTLSTTSISSADINAGTIDGTAIGGSTAAAGSFTTLNTSGAVVFNDAGADVDFRVEGDTNANLIVADAGVDKVGIGTNTFNTNGGVLQVSNGISFPATQSALSDANTLDDYEEGTFTPAYAFATSGSVTYGTQEGRYTKVGRLVTCNIALGLSAVSSPTGNVTITGLPFTSGGGEGGVSGTAIGIMREFANAVTLRLYKSSSSTIMVIEKNATNAGFTALAGSDLGSATLFYFTVTYFAA